VDDDIDDGIDDDIDDDIAVGTKNRTTAHIASRSLNVQV